MEFKFEITEVLSRQIIIQSSSIFEAEKVLRSKYKNANIVLDASDFSHVDFIPLNKEEKERLKSIETSDLTPFFRSSDHTFTLLQGDCIELLKQFEFKFDMIFADPPYFLSNGGISIQNGKVVCVDKGEWDKGGTPESINTFNYEWLAACRDKLKNDGTIWVSGTYHNIFSVANQLTELGFKILNVITWAKTNPPPNISCRYFTFSAEYIIWARKSAKVPHYYNYKLMKHINDDKQMSDVWRLPAIAPWEKSCGKHPCQKPLAVLARIIMASTRPGAWILDPFTGSSTTGIAANLLERRFLGIDKEEAYLNISRKRKNEIEDPKIVTKYQKKIKDIAFLKQMEGMLSEDISIGYDLPF